jgi:hypothetical protein
VGKEVALAMAGAREREASAGRERAEGEVAAMAQAEGGCKGRNAQAPTWPLRRRKAGGSRRLRIGTGGWDANLGRGWAQPSDCPFVERGRWGHRGGELAACQIQAIVGGTGAFGGGVRQHRVGGGILKRKERIGKVIESVRDASGASARDKDNVTAIVREGGRDVKSPNTVVSPRLALERRVVDDHELAGGVDGVGEKIYGRAVQPVPGRQGRI